MKNKMIDVEKIDDAELKKIDEELDKAERLTNKYKIKFDKAQSIVNGTKTLNEVLEKNNMKIKLNEEVEVNDEKIEKLANYLEIEPEEIEQATYDENVYSVEGGSEEYLVCDEDTAREYAEDDIQECFDEMGLDAFSESFQEWIRDYAIDDDLLYDIVKESINSYIYDLDDEEIVDKAIDDGLVSSDEVYEDEEDENGYPTIKEDVDIDDLRDQLVEEELDNVSDYASYIVDNYGEEELDNIIRDNPSAIDINKVIDECISWDGVAHFISTYDGNEIDLGDGLFAYRLN